MEGGTLWRGGPVRAAFWIGVLAGALFGLIQFALTGSAGEAVFKGVFFAVLFGGALALIGWRSRRGSGNLASRDRVTVALIVHRGEAIEDARLASAVLDYASAIRRTQDRDQRYRWVPWVFAGLIVILALDSTVGGSTRQAAVWWALSIFWAFILAWLPRRRAQVSANASRAEDAARRLLPQAPPA